MKTFFKSFAMTAVLTLVASTSLRAEATKELYSDGGLYTNPAGTQFTNVLTWAFSIVNVNGAATDVATNEGLKSFRTNVNTQWGGWGIFNVTGLGSTVVVDRNFSDYANGHLRFQLRSNNPLTVEVEYVSNDAGNPVRKIPISVPSTAGNWVEFVIPFSAFPADFNMARIRSPFSISFTGVTAAAKTWHVDHVRWTKAVGAIDVHPATTQINAGQQRQFTVEGRSLVGNEPIILYSTFSVAAAVGSVNPAAPIRSMGTVFTAGTSDGSISVRSFEDNRTTTASIDVVTTDLNERTGILSESISGLTLDTDSALIVFNGAGAPQPGLSDDISDYREGFSSLRTIVNHTSPLHYSGWSVQAGVTGTPDTTTRDMSKYYQGSLRFWIKAPPALAGKLWIGMRSGNVPAGKEISTASLSGLVTFDNTWRPVAIPISMFAKPRPWADLSRMKNLVTFSVTGPTGGAQTFYVDNIRWDTQMPGALTGITVSPLTALIPLNGRRQFIATGQSATGPVDIVPTWSFTGASLGTILTPVGDRTILRAAGSPVSGGLRATYNGFSAQSNVTVANITYTQSYNVYSDMGSGGTVGVATGPDGSGTTLTLAEVAGTTGDVAPEGQTYRRATFTLRNQGATPNAFALWFTEDTLDSRYMRYYQNGYLRFWIRTRNDLQISLRSANITAGTELSKIRLSELGVPFDGAWHEVIVSLADFKARDPRLNFDQIKTFFTITALSQLSGQLTNQTFDIDDVKWLTADADVPSEAKIYQGLKDLQHPSTGLVRSFNTRPSAFTYDQALAAMAYTYRKDTHLSKRIFDTYRNNFFNDATFVGFADEYDVGTLAVRNANRLMGPNTWFLLALMHYRNVTGSTENDQMINRLRTWMLSYRALDGSFKFGNSVNVSEREIRSTEHNFDAYAAMNASAYMTGNVSFRGIANNVKTWLDTRMWNVAEQRFNVGTGTDGITPNTDRALDAYSWAILAMSSYTSVASLAETHFGTTSVSAVTGALIKGFDFSGCFDRPVDKDAVWLEGTAQMALAFLNAGNRTKFDEYMNELNKGVFQTSPLSQGLTYATRAGTAYGPCTPSNAMDSLNAAVAPMAWYLFAVREFNPFKIYWINSVQAMNRVTHAPTSAISWSSLTAVPGAPWTIADQYIKMDAQPISTDVWGIQIYTHNSSATANPRYLDPTPLVPNNADSNPAGLVLDVAASFPTPTPGPTTTPEPLPDIRATLPLAWSIKESTMNVGVELLPADPNLGPETGPGNRYQWFYMKDKGTPAIDRNGDGLLQPEPIDGEAFSNGEDYIVIRKGTGIHGSQGPFGYFPSMNPDYIYLEADFRTAAAQVRYATRIHIEFFIE